MVVAVVVEVVVAVRVDVGSEPAVTYVVTVTTTRFGCGERGRIAAALAAEKVMVLAVRKVERCILFES